MKHEFDSDPVDLAGLKGSTVGRKLEWSQIVLILAIIWIVGFVIFMFVTCAQNTVPNPEYREYIPGFPP